MRALAKAVFLLTLGAKALWAEGGASAAGQIFDFGAGGRALGMGSAHTAVVHDATSLYYNPSGLGLLESRQILVMRANLFGGATYDYVGYAQNFRKRPGGWGVQILRLGISGAEGRDEANNPTSGFSYSEQALGLGWGFRGVVFPQLSLGLGLKYLTRTLASSSDKLIGLDLGSQYGPILDERLTLGLVVQNAISKTQGDTSDKLPTGLRVGAAYRIAGPMILAADVSDSKEFRFGTEYVFGITSLRAGFAGEGVSFGGGMLFKKAFSLDLAVLNHPTLGVSQRISLGYRFGSKKPPKRQAFATEYIGNGESELKQRHYFQAAKDIETAVGIDPTIGGGQWKRKAARLHDLIYGMGIEWAPQDQADLAANTMAADLAYRSIAAYINGEESDAMLLAHVAAGSADRNSIFMKLLNAMARATKQQIVREDIRPPDGFLEERKKRSIDAIYAHRYDVSIRASQEAIVIAPEDGSAWARLGSSYYASGDRTKAKEAYEKAVQYDPNNAKLKEFMKENFKEETNR